MLLDVFLVVTTVGIAVAGYRQGLVTGVLNFAGLVLGSLAGMQIAPKIAGRFSHGSGQALVGIAVVLVSAGIGQLAGTAVGAAIRRRIPWHPLQRIDAVGGALVSAAGVLLITWLIATQIAHSPFTVLARQVKGSRVLRSIDGMMPPAPDLMAPFRRLIAQQGFPQVFAGIHGDRSRPVAAPDKAVLTSTAVVSSRRSIVRVTGIAKACSRRVEGTGFVYAEDYVMTNAHVVAGVVDAQVTPDRGRARAARVVLFDPKRDVAVLYVGRLGLAPLTFAGPAAADTSAVVAGYPQDGPFGAVAARVRDQLTAVGRDIYERGKIRREVYSIRARVLPGNSGGPLLSSEGKVFGVVFASAADDPETGYALTAGEVAASATQGRRSTAAVGTAGCT